MSDTRDSYSRLSGVYGALSDSGERAFGAHALQYPLKPLPSESVLQPCCGVGQVPIALAEAVGPQGRVAGLDIADGMVDQSRKGCWTTDWPTASICSAAPARTSDPAAVFDAALVTFTVELVDDADRPVVLAEVRRVPKPGGRLSGVHVRHRRISDPRGLYRWTHEHSGSVVDWRPIDAAIQLDRAGRRQPWRSCAAPGCGGLAVCQVLARP